MVSLGERAEIIRCSCSHLWPAFSTWRLIIGITQLCFLVFAKSIVMQTLLRPKIDLSKSFAFLDQCIVVRGETERIEGSVGAALEVWTVNVIELALVLFIDLVKHEGLLSSEISQSHIHPAGNCPRKIPLRLCWADHDHFPFWGLVVRKESTEVWIKLAEIDILHS